MRLSAFLAALFLCVVTFSAGFSPASAASSDQQIINSLSTDKKEAVLSLAALEPEASTTQAPKEHVVSRGENLTKIASQHETTWQRIYAKNTNISHPDVINVGDKLVIPKSDETLPDRTLPQAVQPVKATVKVTSVTKKAQPAAKYAASYGSSAGNTYTRGYCTWYAKSKRPDLPNNLGNADTWAARAAAQGIPTGSTPRAGAIGQRGMHVVYVERVNADGSVFVSEMNYVGFNVVSSRTVPGNYFYYIY